MLNISLAWNGWNGTTVISIDHARRGCADGTFERIGISLRYGRFPESGGIAPERVAGEKMGILLLRCVVFYAAIRLSSARP